MWSLLLLTVLCISQQCTCTPTLYYTVSQNEIGLYGPSSSPQQHSNKLLTLDQYFTVDDILTSSAVQHHLQIYHPTDCFLHDTGQHAPTQPLYDILTSHHSQFGFEPSSSASDVKVISPALQLSEQPLTLQCFTSGSGGTKSHVYQLRSAALNRAITTHNRLHIVTAASQRSDEQQRQYPFDALEIMGQTLSSDWSWLKEFVQNHWGPLHPLNVYTGKDTGVFHLNTGKQLSSVNDVSTDDSSSTVNIAIASDWAAGTLEADLVAYSINDGIDPRVTNKDVNLMSLNAYDWTFHLGDVYYIGTTNEVQSNALGNVSHIIENPPVKGVTWPIGRFGSWAQAGNHELLSRAYGYFDTLLPALGLRDSASSSMTGQQTSFNIMVNKYWRIVNLDTGYNSYSKKLENHDNKQPDGIVDWLKNVAKLYDSNDKRGIILMTHHQPTSAFLDPYLATAYQLLNDALIDAGRTVVWLYGHEHRLGAYSKQFITNDKSQTLSWHGRCVGNGGFPPIVVTLPSTARAAGLMAFDDRVYMNTSSTFGGLQIGYNGYVRLSLEQKTALLEYYTLADHGHGLSWTEPTVMMREMFRVSDAGNVELVWQEFDEGMTIVTHVESSRFSTA